MGLRRKDVSGDARWFGIGIHLALAEWYGKGKRRGPHPADTFADWVGEEIAYIASSRETWEDRPKYEDAAELGEEMLVAYIDKYERDSQWYMIATEQPFNVLVKRGSAPVARFVSRFDGVFRDEADGQIYLLETKTASQISLAYLELDDQAGAYWAVASAVLQAKGVLKSGQNIAGIQYNFLRKCRQDQRPQNEIGQYLNKDGSVSKKQPPPAFVRDIIERSPPERRTQMNRLADEVAVMNAIRQGVIPVTKSTTKDCIFCDFFAMCRLHERGGEAWKSVMKSDFEVTDPYEDQRKSA
jgi:hypothetical protein